MQVEEKISMNDYWNDNRFSIKKPIINGSLVQMYGDNIYHQDETSKDWIQEDSAHSMYGGLQNKGHVIRDTGGKFVLISKTFYYFGDTCPKIPNEFLDICCEGRDIKSNLIPTETADNFITWVQNNFEIGIHGDPISWDIYKLSEIDYNGF